MEFVLGVAILFAILSIVASLIARKQLKSLREKHSTAHK